MTTPARGHSEPDGFDIATRWMTLPPEHLEVAMKSLEPELARRHELQMNRERRAHALSMASLCAGFAISVGCLVAAVFLGLGGQLWLALTLSGPSLLTLAKLFVLGSSDATDVKQLGLFQRIMVAAFQGQGPNPPP